MPYITTIHTNNILNKYKLIDTELKLNYRTIFTNISQYHIKFRKCVNLELHLDNGFIKIKDIFYLPRIILYYIKNKVKNDNLIKILKYYRISYDYFIDLIRINKDLSTIIKREEKKKFMELLQY
jgi:hypothetical protein